MISESIIEKLMTDFNLDIEVATDRFCTSKTFTQLSDETTNLHLKSWQEIYEMLKIEIKNSHEI